MSDQKLNRRQFLERAAMLGATAVGAGSLLAACEPSDQGAESGGEPGGPGSAEGAGGDFSCNDSEALAELNDGQIERRENQQYTDDSPEANQRCDNCLHWEEPAGGENCGGCAVLPGPVHPAGWCDLWQEAA